MHKYFKIIAFELLFSIFRKKTVCLYESLPSADSPSVIKDVHYNSIPNCFNGQIMYFTLGRTFLNSYVYKSGKIVGSLASHTASSNLTINSTGGLHVNQFDVQTICQEAYNYNYLLGHPEQGVWVDNPLMRLRMLLAQI